MGIAVDSGESTQSTLARAPHQGSRPLNPLGNMAKEEVSLAQKSGYAVISPEIDMALPKPTKADLLASAGKRIPDVIGPDLKVLFCGINPGLYSGYTGYHFARPGNRFWPALHASGFTERLLAPSENQVLLASGCGITNLVERSTATAAELTREELVAGAKRLAEKAEHYRPRVIAVLGVTAYRDAFERPKAQLGEQPERIGPSVVWVLPNPSGLNAHVTPTKLAQMLREFRLEIERRFPVGQKA